jgi:hypothetical protein
MTRQRDNVLPFEPDPARRRLLATIESEPRLRTRLWPWVIAAAIPVGIAWIVAAQYLGWADRAREVADDIWMAGGVSAETTAQQDSEKIQSDAVADAAAPAPSVAPGPAPTAAPPQAASAATAESAPRAAGITLVYRCVDPSGQSVYSDKPCDGVVEVRQYDERSANTYTPD